MIVNTLAALRPVSRPASEPPKRDLAPCHKFPTKDAYTPTPRPEPGEWKDLKNYEVVVVGGGMAGLNTAWNLQKQGHEVAVFERTRHVGGRVRSRDIENEQKIDLGAMRYIPSRHHRVRHLVEDVLGLATKPFVVGGEQNLQYFRGQRNTNQEVAADPSLRPFNLKPEERGKSVDELLAHAIRSVVPNFEELSPEQWDEVKKTTTIPVKDPTTGQHVEVPLAQVGLDNVLGRSLSPEAKKLVVESIGYRSFLSNWDAGEALEELAADFRPGTSYRTPVEGMEQIPRGLTKLFLNEGGEFNNFQTLRAVDYDPEHGFLLEFQHTRKGTITRVVSEKLVLAMPQKPLRDLLDNSPDLRSSALDTHLDKVTAHPMTRIFVAYDEPWWQDTGIETGRSVTDLPLGQVYYYGHEEDQRPFVMVYADGQDSEYFEGLQNPADGGVSKRLCATPQLTEEVHHQLEELHGRDLPEPTGFLYKRWASEYFGGAYHTWDPGSKPWEVTEEMVQPLGPDVPLFVAGEAYSTTQGWMEGALETSEKVLELF